VSAGCQGRGRDLLVVPGGPLHGRLARDADLARPRDTRRKEPLLTGRPVGKREVQAARRREQLLQTAVALFTERGYRGTSVRDITRAAGVTEAVLYHYFDSKSDLLTAVLARYAPFASYGELIAQADAAAVEDVLARLGHEFLRLVRERRSFVLTLLSEAPVDPDIAAVLSGMLRSIVGDIAAYLARATGVDPRVNARVVGIALQGGLLVHFLSTALAPIGTEALPSDDEVVAQLVHLVLNGLLPRG
jgi:AcrR family transcriptional regulator